MTFPDPAPAPGTGSARKRRLDAACVTGLLAGVALGYLATFLTPTLIAHHTVLLELMGETTTSMVTAGALVRTHRLALVLALGAPLLCSLVFDPFWWWAGRRFAEPMLDYYRRRGPRWSRWVDRSERLVERYGVWALVTEYYLPVPTGLIQILTGSSGLPLPLFIVADLVGTLLWDGLLVGLGWGLGRPAVHIADRVSHDGLLVTLALVELTVLLALRSRAARAAPEPGRAVPARAAVPATLAALAAAGLGAAGAALGAGYVRERVSDLLWPALVGLACALAVRFAPRRQSGYLAGLAVAVAVLSALSAGWLAHRSPAGLAGPAARVLPALLGVAGVAVGLGLGRLDTRTRPARPGAAPTGAAAEEATGAGHGLPAQGASGGGTRQ